MPVQFPGDAIKEAFQYEIIQDGELWMDMLEKRNLMVHTYNETSADLALSLIISRYFMALEQVFIYLKGRL